MFCDKLELCKVWQHFSDIFRGNMRKWDFRFKMISGSRGDPRPLCLEDPWAAWHGKVLPVRASPWSDLPKMLVPQQPCNALQFPCTKNRKTGKPMEHMEKLDSTATLSNDKNRSCALTHFGFRFWLSFLHFLSFCLYLDTNTTHACSVIYSLYYICLFDCDGTYWMWVTGCPGMRCYTTLCFKNWNRLLDVFGWFGQSLSFHPRDVSKLKIPNQNKRPGTLNPQEPPNHPKPSTNRVITGFRYRFGKR